MNFAHCLHIILVIGKYGDVFRRDFLLWGEGRRRGLLERIFPWRMFPWGKGHFDEGGADCPSII